MPVDDGLASEQWIRFQYCVDLDALVLTKKLGYIPLRDVTTNDLVWDGFEYAQHEGLVYRGWKECVRVDGVWMTPEHKVLVAGKWVEAGELVPESPREARDVADLLNCGSRFRFTVCGESAPLIVSNCRDRGHLEFINKADKCDKFFAGEQWLQSDLNALALQRDRRSRSTRSSRRSARSSASRSTTAARRSSARPPARSPRPPRS